MWKTKFLLIPQRFNKNNQIVFSPLRMTWLKISDKLIPRDIFINFLLLFAAEKCFDLNSLENSSKTHISVVLRLEHRRKIQVFFNYWLRSQSGDIGNSFYYEIVVPVDSSEGVLKELHNLFGKHAALRNSFELLLSFQFFNNICLSKTGVYPHESLVYIN